MLISSGSSLGSSRYLSKVLLSELRMALLFGVFDALVKNLVSQRVRNLELDIAAPGEIHGHRYDNLPCGPHSAPGCCTWLVVCPPVIQPHRPSKAKPLYTMPVPCEKLNYLPVDRSANVPVVLFQRLGRTALIGLSDRGVLADRGFLCGGVGAWHRRGVRSYICHE